MTTHPVCYRCHRPCRPEGIGSGYASRHDGTRFCYDCDAVLALEAAASAEPGDHAPSFYIDTSGHHVTTWPGRRVGSVVRWGAPHPFSSERRHVRVAIHGAGEWYGTAAEGMLAVLRKAKA